tara:strand:- start:1389 stop:2492 length:1104 start_codon:yes stop_codon:yes gene_type:complete
MFWTKKYKPKSFGELIFKYSYVDILQKLSKNESTPNILLYGITGSGKSTLVKCFLRSMFGSDVEKMQIEEKTIALKGNKQLVINIKESQFHIEVDLSHWKNNDHKIIQHLIKNSAATITIQTALLQNVDVDLKDEDEKFKFRFIIFHNAESLSKEAQQALRRTMEVYSESCRFIFITSTLSSLIEPLRSRCFCLRIPAPTKPDITKVLKYILKKEQIKVPLQYLKNIAENSRRNLQEAILLLQQSVWNKQKLKASIQTYPKLDWLVFIDYISQSILKEQTAKSFLKIREYLYRLIINCIPAKTILLKLSESIIKQIDDDNLYMSIWSLTIKYDHRIVRGNKSILHLQGFIGEMMAIASNYSKSKSDI